jgi:hypothetical protein
MLDAQVVQMPPKASTTEVAVTTCLPDHQGDHSTLLVEVLVTVLGLESCWDQS